jgi:membrane-bound lytic murein transglycosylase D
MLNSSVPFVGTLVIALAMPVASSSGLPAFDETKTVAVAVPSTTNKTVSFALPGQDEMSYVHAYIRENDESLLAVKQRSKRYFKMIESVLQKFGLPSELKYLAVIESDLKSTAVSRVGAKGPWQLMASTALDLGLKVDSAQDERTNFYKSTKAAALYLRDLHRTFKDWRLVLAAYNAGPLPVFRAMERSKSKDFRMLERYLPNESRTHVKRFMATAYYFDAISQSAPAIDAAHVPAAVPA